MAIVSEHEQAASKIDAPTTQGKEEESVVAMVKKLLQRSKAGTKEFRGQWPRNYQFVFGGRQWPMERPEWRFSEVVNLVWADIVTEVGIQTDARPKVDYIETDPSDVAFVSVLKELNDVNWQKYPWLQRIAECVLDTKWVHVSHLLDEWDPELENGLGDIKKTILDPYGCYWDPTACDEDSLRYFIYIEPIPTERIKKKYPKVAKDIKPDIDVVGGGSGVPFERTITDADKTAFTLSGARGRRPSMVNERFGGEEMTLLIRCWVKDDSVEEMIEEKPVDGAEVRKEYVLKKKYPAGRYIEVANNVLLYDGHNGPMVNGQTVPYKHCKIPVVRFVNYSYPREYPGENEVTHTMGPQIICNYIWSFALDSMKQASNPKEVFSAANLDASEKSSNMPGEVMVLPDFQGYRREPGLGIPANLQNLFEEAMKIKDKVQGLQDVMRGAVDPGVTSGLLFDGYVESAQTRPRYKNRNLDQSLQRIGQLDAAMYLQFYTVQRTFRVTNKEGWPEYVSFFVQDQADGTTVATVNRQTPNEQGQYVSQPQQQMVVKGTPDVQVVSGSSIPFQKAQQYNRSKELFQLKAIDQQALLDEIDYPNREEILSRMQQQAQAQAQQEMQNANG